MLSIWSALILSLIRISCNPGMTKASKKNSKEKKVKYIFKMGKDGIEGKKAPIYNGTIKISKVDNVNKHQDTTVKDIQADAYIITY